jgi:hypothetical protein
LTRSLYLFDVKRSGGLEGLRENQRK